MNNEEIKNKSMSWMWKHSYGKQEKPDNASFYEIECVVNKALALKEDETKPYIGVDYSQDYIKEIKTKLLSDLKGKIEKEMFKYRKLGKGNMETYQKILSIFDDALNNQLNQGGNTKMIKSEK